MHKKVQIDKKHFWIGFRRGLRQCLFVTGIGIIFSAIILAGMEQYKLGLYLMLMNVIVWIDYILLKKMEFNYQ